MSITVKQVADYLEEIAPTGLALDGDPVGLQIGSMRAPVDRILVALDFDRSVLEEAGREQAGLVVTHHPLLFNPLSQIDEDTTRGQLIADTIRNKVNVFSAHTNLDVAPGGTSHLLADLVGLAREGREVIEVTGEEKLLKLVVFVPAGYEEQVRNALSEAGAGWIGNYSHCTFQAPGTGTFMPREGTNPFIGEQGKVEQVPELRLETILPEWRQKRVLAALMAAHPYEEVAYDLYPLALPGTKVGLGVIGRLEKPAGIEEIMSRCLESFASGGLRWWAPADKPVARVAVCGGSGGSLVEAAARRGAELFIAGDFRYHDWQAAASAGMALLDAGHDFTELPAVEYLSDHLRRRLSEDGHDVPVLMSKTGPARWRYQSR